MTNATPLPTLPFEQPEPLSIAPLLRELQVLPLDMVDKSISLLQANFGRDCGL